MVSSGIVAAFPWRKNASEKPRAAERSHRVLALGKHFPISNAATLRTDNLAAFARSALKKPRLHRA